MDNALTRIDLEHAVLGCIINDGVLIKTARAAGVKRDCFTEEASRTVWQTMEEMDAQRRGIDFITLSARLPNLTDCLAELAASAPTSALFQEQIGDLVALTAARVADMAMEETRQAIAAAPLESDEIQRRLDAITAAFRQGAAGRGLPRLRDVGAAYLAQIEGRTLRDVPLLKGWGLSAFHSGETFVLAADTGSGKTAFAAGAVNVMLDAGLSVLYVCNESASADILARIVAARCGVPHFVIQNRRATAAQLTAHSKAFQEIMQREKQMFFHCLGDRLPMTPFAVAGSLKQAEAKAGRVDIVIIDFLQNMKPDILKRNATKTTDMEDVITALHDMAADAGAGLLVLAQYSRQGQEAARGGVEPQLNWLRDCGSIENLAHVVAHLVRHEERGKPTESFLVCNQKHRNCPPFRVPLVWTGASYGMAAPSPNADAGDIPDGGVDF